MRLDSVTFRYGRRGPWVLRDVSLSLHPGDIVELTGPNGAGKSTLLRLLAGLHRPRGGTITGRPSVVGYAPERFPTDQPFTVTAYLAHMAALHGLPTSAAARWSHLLNLDHLLNTRLPELSKGSAQKVGLIQALLPTPKLLLLDEPFSGLDAATLGLLPELLASLAKAGATIVISDHQRVLHAPEATVHLPSIRHLHLANTALTDRVSTSTSATAASAEASPATGTARAATASAEASPATGTARAATASTPAPTQPSALASSAGDFSTTAAAHTPSAPVANANGPARTDTPHQVIADESASSVTMTPSDFRTAAGLAEPFARQLEPSAGPWSGSPRRQVEPPGEGAHFPARGPAPSDQADGPTPSGRAGAHVPPAQKDTAHIDEVAAPKRGVEPSVVGGAHPAPDEATPTNGDARPAQRTEVPEGWTVLEVIVRADEADDVEHGLRAAGRIVRRGGGS